MNNIAVIIPCHNEEITIGKVIKDFAGYLPKEGCI
jgi:glycosyltransferase involved in cell wall biosynthesis